MDSPHKISTTPRIVLKEAINALSSEGIEQSRLEAKLLLAHVLGIRKEDLIIRPDQELTDLQEEQYQHLVERRCRREPLAYIVGHREFWSLEFKVNPKVLIPRPETEGVIEHLLSLSDTDSGSQATRILDLGTGSGILAIVAALEFPTVRVTAVDISNEVLGVAQENALQHRVAERVEFLNMDLMQSWSILRDGLYDYILSNPPYIASDQFGQLMPDVRDYEPRAALDGGPEGLVYYRKIIAAAFTYLRPGGYLIFEVGDHQAGLVKQIFQACNCWDTIEIVPDLSGRDRVVSARSVFG